METANTRRQTQRLALQWTEGITGAKTCLLNTSSLFVVAGRSLNGRKSRASVEAAAADGGGRGRG